MRGGICFDHRVDGHGHGSGRDNGLDPVSAAYRLLREQEPTVDVQVVSAGNVTYLVPASFRSARRRFGTWAAVRHALRSTTAGAVLVDGVVAGDVEQLGAAGVLRVVRERAVPQAGSGTSSTAATV